MAHDSKSLKRCLTVASFKYSQASTQHRAAPIHLANSAGPVNIPVFARLE
jgi:hypothetical protein